MDAIIQMYDLKKGNEKTAEKMEEQLNEWRYDKMEDTVNKKMTLKALSIVQSQVCVPDFPTCESPAATMAKQAFSIVSDCIGNLVSEEKVKRQEFHGPLFDFVMQLISAGPGTTHCELIEEVFNVYDVEFQEYFHSLKGDQIKKVLSACKKEYKTKEKISYEDFADKVTSGMRCVLDNGFTDEQCEQHRAEFLDLYLYFEYGFLDRKEEERRMMSDMACWLYHHLDSEPFKGIKDKAPYVGLLNRLKEVILAKSFPTDEEAVERAESGLNCFFEGIKEQGNLKDLYEEIMDFSAAVFAGKAGKPVHKVIEAIGYYFYHVDEKHVKGNAKMFEVICTKLTQIVEQSKDQSFLAVKFADAIVTEVLIKTMSNTTPNHSVLLIKLIKALIQVPETTTLYGASEALREKEKALKWKEHLPAAKDIFVTISKVKVPESDDQEEIIEKYKNFTEYFLDQLKKARVLDEFKDGLVQFALGILESKNAPLYELAQEAAERIEFDAKKNKALVMEVFKRIDPVLKDDSYPWFENYSLTSLTQDLISNAIQGVKNGNMLDEKDYKILISILKTVMVKDFIHPDTGEAGSIFYIVFTTLASNVFQKLDDINELRWAQPVFGNLFDLLEHEEGDVRDIASMELDVVGRKGGELLAPYMDKLLKSFFEHETYSMMATICSAYPFNPGPVNKEFQKLMKYHDTGDSSVKMQTIQLYAAVAKKHPEQFTEANLKDLWKEAKDDQDSTVMILMVMEDVAKKHPDKVGKMLPQLMDNKGMVSYAQPSLINVLKAVGIGSEKYAEQIIDYYAKTLDGPEEQTLFLCTLDGLRNVGGRHLPLLSKHKALIEGVQKRATIQYTKDGCAGLIDIIEGRSLAGLSEDIKETQEDVVELDTKVTKTQTQVKAVSKEVGKQKKEIKTVKKDVKAQGKKIDQLEETVDDTVAKVEEIDSKTLSHAPFWSRDVSKLLNPKDEHDWRLLSSRLGYSNDDIRGWAQQHDPCMAMLNEWYAVRKTSEATFAVLTALQEMNRMDAAVIVENAMKMAETVVEDEPFEYDTPPAVFISYQWGIQNEVKLLKQHLEMAGYECWMDIGQMGGGDKLFEKIDQGIRASKVIISCVTEKYAKSPNCNREVNLSVSLGRPIIPLLMEKQTWPPAGSMGPIFSEYLFIRFFTRPGEETGDQRYWSAAKFQELLMQLNYNGIVPDEEKVQKQYKNWWTPVVEEIKIEKKKDGGKGSQTQSKAAESVEIAAVSPDVFISYQWGKQKQIMLLYRRLTGMGYTCWMDIYQMGGGDSLYDKIDRGVRGCKIVLSCVTTKYALSANCRREVSLADALKKPIVPLLLEKITWPPTGPMSMVFTQLLYINFSKDEAVQEKWIGKEFEELVGKIQANVPALTAEDKGTATKKDSKPDPKSNKPSNENSAKPPQKETKPSATSTPSHKNSGKPPPSQSKSPQPSGKQTSAANDKPQTNTPEKKENARQEPPPSKPKESSPEPQKSKSCILL